MLPPQGLALPRGGLSARRGPWHPVYVLRQAVLHLGPGWMPATPEVPAFGLFAPVDTLTQLSQAVRGQGLTVSDLNLAHCAQGPASGAGRAEFQPNKVEKLPFRNGLYLVHEG